MTTVYQLKPFSINLSDLKFMRDQIAFRPLFDGFGNAIIAWNGTGAIYNSNNMATRSQLWDGLSVLSAPATELFGTSYATVTAAQGLRDVTGHNNNLSLVHQFWGAVDQPFLQSVAPDFSSYIKPMAALDANAFYGANTFSGAMTAAMLTGSTDYTKNSLHPGNTPATGNVVDYTPRMISRLITTGGATPLQDANGQVLHWNAALYAATTPAALAYQALVNTVSVGGVGLIEGAAIMSSFGIAGMGGG